MTEGIFLVEKYLFTGKLLAMFTASSFMEVHSVTDWIISQKDKV